MDNKKIYELYYNIPDDANYYYAIVINKNIENLNLGTFIKSTNKIVTFTDDGLLINKSILIAILKDYGLDKQGEEFSIRNCIQFFACKYIGREFTLPLDPYLKGFLLGLYDAS